MQLSNHAPVAAPGGAVAADLRRRLSYHRQALLDLIATLDADALAWSPDDGIPSAAARLEGLARREEELVFRHLHGPEAGSGPVRPRPPSPPRHEASRILRELGRVRTVTERWISTASETDLDAELSPEPVRMMATPRELLETLVAHDVHHRAQIGLLMQLMDPRQSVPPVP